MKIGNEVKLRILDHCMGSYDKEEGLPVFEIFGRVLEINDHFVKIGSWTNIEGEDPDNNTESFTIIKAAILETTIYK